uniref:Uncharacterized protein n=1 Tax=Nicotiana tabacum TaxID=4097 RepID=A0A1S4CBN2_TOBAC|nr:uncharacterized protein LOC104101592 [Nicotiana tomentosiformis]XP_016498364.1 PREDICTED: uncharacterized protein LOC107817103 [Nicotiana tabacum]
MGILEGLMGAMMRCMVALALGSETEEQTRVFRRGRSTWLPSRAGLPRPKIDYFLLRRCDKGLCTDCKVILSQNLMTQHRLSVMDLDIVLKRKKRVRCGRPKIGWGALIKDKAQELQDKLLVVGAWMSSGDASSIWSKMVDNIKEATREVLGVSKGYIGGHKGDWWWNEEVQRKVEAKKAAYLKLVESTDEGKKRNIR